MNVTLYRTLEVYADITSSLEPKNYLHCNTIEELKDNIKDDLIEKLEELDCINIDMCTMDVSEVDYSLEIPDKFIEEWNKLKLNGKN